MTTTMTETRELLVVPGGHIDRPAYASWMVCPDCQGEGNVEYQESGPYSPTAIEPRWSTRPCQVCGTEDTAGPGVVPIVRCATCALPIHADQLTDEQHDDYEQGWHRELDLRERHATASLWCQCDSERGRDGVLQTHAHVYAIMRAVGLADSAGEILATREYHGMDFSFHGVPLGVILHITMSLGGKATVGPSGKYAWGELEAGPVHVVMFSPQWSGHTPEHLDLGIQAMPDRVTHANT